MNSINQSVPHPDTESLNAFVEQVLPATERDQILAHMATCSRCRQIVYLAQQAGVGPLKLAAVLTPQSHPPRRSWLTSWRVAWIPVGALAGLIGFAVIHHFQRVAVEEQMARNTPPLAASVAPSAQPEPQQQNKSAMTAMRKDAPLAEKNKTLREPAQPSLALPRQPLVLQQNALGYVAGVGGGAAGARSFNAELAPRPRLYSPQKPSSLGGPMAANQLQQQNAAVVQQQQNASAMQQSARQQLQSTGLIALGASRKESYGDKKETKTGNADTLTANAPVPLAQAEVAPSSTSLDEVISAQAVSSLKAKAAKTANNTILPNGVAALSVATAGGRAIAIDPSGNLFVVESPGTHWIPVTTQWTGRAILVRAHQIQAASGGSLVAPSSPAPSTPVFELMNDKIQTWVSSDGKVWQPQILPAK
jgi:hypothetical protein